MALFIDLTQEDANFYQLVDRRIASVDYCQLLPFSIDFISGILWIYHLLNIKGKFVTISYHKKMESVMYLC